LSQLQDLADSKNATDPRDTVFGFHGCLHPDVRRLIEVDYSQDLEQVLTHLTKALLQKAIVLDDILTGKTLCLDNASLAPSWVWTPLLTNVKRYHVKTESFITTREWQAAGRLPLFYDLIDRDTVLHVKGRTIFTVEAIAPPLHPTHPHDVDELFRDEVDMLINHLLLVLQLFKVPLGGRWFDQFNAAFHLALFPLLRRRVRDWLRARRLFSRWLSDWLFKAFYNRHFALLSILNHHDSRMFSCKAGAEITYGLGPMPVIPGDKICVIQGCAVPLVFRQVEDHHILIGRAFVYVLMTGMAVKKIEAGEEEAQDFFLR
jgi:hypothetical protein